MPKRAVTGAGERHLKSATCVKLPSSAPQRGVAPTLLVWGKNDPLVPPAVGNLLQEGIPDSRLLVLEKAAHVPMFDLPEEIDEALLTFLAGKPIREQSAASGT